MDANTGNLGIGIVTPVNKLDVVGNISASVVTASLFFGTASYALNTLRLPVTVTSSYTLGATDYTLICKHGAPITITIPAASGSNQRMFNVKNANTGSWAITITGSAIGTLIDNDKSLIINSPWANASLYCDSNQWYIL
jgi:hypothetical protein